MVTQAWLDSKYILFYTCWSGVDGGCGVKHQGLDYISCPILSTRSVVFGFCTDQTIITYWLYRNIGPYIGIVSVPTLFELDIEEALYCSRLSLQNHEPIGYTQY